MPISFHSIAKNKGKNREVRRVGDILIGDSAMFLKFIMKVGTSSTFLKKGNGNDEMDNDKKSKERNPLLNDKEINAKMGR